MTKCIIDDMKTCVEQDCKNCEQYQKWIEEFAEELRENAEDNGKRY